MMANMYATSVNGATGMGPLPLSGLGFDVGSVLETAAGVLPDAWQEAGQDVLDTVTAPVRELAKTISPDAYAALDAIAQEQIDAARRGLGLPALNPSAAAAQGGTSTPGTQPGTSTAGGDTTATTPSVPEGQSIGSNVGTALDHARNVYGYVGVGVGLLGGWYVSGRLQRGKRGMRGKGNRGTGKRVAAALMMGAGVGLMAGMAGDAIARA